MDHSIKSSVGCPVVHWETVHQTVELLLPQFNLVLELALLNNKGRFHFHKMLIISHTLLWQVAGQDVVDHTLSPVKVLLQLLGVLMLTDQQFAFLGQSVLKVQHVSFYSTNQP